jgi:hypothetical protein
MNNILKHRLRFKNFFTLAITFHKESNDPVKIPNFYIIELQVLV